MIFQSIFIVFGIYCRLTLLVFSTDPFCEAGMGSNVEKITGSQQSDTE
jgi:hypothetical protein